MPLTDFETYHRELRKMRSFIRTGHAIVYPTLGLVNEAGELAGKVKKIFRDEGGVISQADRATLKGELGDMLWYLTQMPPNSTCGWTRWPPPTLKNSFRGWSVAPSVAKLTTVESDIVYDPQATPDLRSAAQPSAGVYRLPLIICCASFTETPL